MKRPMTTTSQSTDFDVISGPSMASACPVVESVPVETTKDTPTGDIAQPENREAAA